MGSSGKALDSGAVKMSNSSQELAKVQGLIQQGKFAEAGTLLDAVLKVDSQNPGAWFYYALAKEGSGDRSRAIDGYRKSLALAPSSPQALNNLGYLLLKEGQFDEAEESLCKALELQPGYLQALKNLGDCVGTTGRASLWLAKVNQAMVRSDRVETTRGCGKLGLLFNKYELAVECFGKVLRSGQMTEEDFHNFVESAFLAGSCSALKDSILPMERQLAQRAWPAFAYSRFLAACGEFEQAKSWLQMASRLDPARIKKLISDQSGRAGVFADSVEYPYMVEGVYVEYVRMRWQISNWSNYEVERETIVDLCRSAIARGEVPPVWPAFGVFFSCVATLRKGITRACKLNDSSYIFLL